MKKDKSAFWRVYTDGGARGNPGPAAVGVVVKDEKGKRIFSQAKAIGRATNNQAEYQALIAALVWLNKQPSLPARIEFFLDSQLVVSQMKGEYRVKSGAIKPLWRRAKELEFSLRPREISYCLIPRRLNFEADRLLNQALDLLK